MIETVAEHSFETLGPNSAVLDLGCIGFEFANEMRRRGHRVHAVDIQELDGDYDRVGITDYDGEGYIKSSVDKQAFRLSKSGVYLVPCMTLLTYSRSKNRVFWDLIKMDIEGSELEVIHSLDVPPARQLSIEFHLHTKVYDAEQVGFMVDKLTKLGYRTVQHELTSQHGCGKNYWDSLFVI